MSSRATKSRSSKFKKLFRGKYNYINNDQNYADETFEVFKNKKELTTHFDSEILSRIQTGEMLKIQVENEFTKDWVPLNTKIERILGKNHIIEIYKYDQKANKLFYSFQKDEREEKAEIIPPPKFQIITPATCTSLIFLLSKKIDPTSKNYFHCFESPNIWDYLGSNKTKTLIATRENLGESVKIKVKNKDLETTKFKIYEQDDKNDKYGVTDQLEVFISPHLGMPYKVDDCDGTVIEVLYLNNFDDIDESEEDLMPIE